MSSPCPVEGSSQASFCIRIPCQTCFLVCREAGIICIEFGITYDPCLTAYQKTSLAWDANAKGSLRCWTPYQKTSFLCNIFHLLKSESLGDKNHKIDAFLMFLNNVQTGT